MARRPSKKSPQHITSALVGRHDAIRDHKSHGSEVVSNNADGNICRLRAVMVSYAGFFYNTVENIFDGIDIEDGICSLHYAGHSLKSHAGINVRMR